LGSLGSGKATIWVDHLECLTWNQPMTGKDKLFYYDKEKITHTSCIMHAHINPFVHVTTHPCLSRMSPFWQSLRHKRLTEKLNILMRKSWFIPYVQQSIIYLYATRKYIINLCYGKLIYNWNYFLVTFIHIIQKFQI
jgi:hypothetical protein